MAEDTTNLAHRDAVEVGRHPPHLCWWICSRRPEGATIAQIVEATGWQPHTVRGAFAGALKKRHALSKAPPDPVQRQGRIPTERYFWTNSVMM